MFLMCGFDTGRCAVAAFNSGPIDELRLGFARINT